MRDLRLEPVPHYNSFNNKTDSELVYPPMHSFHLIQRNKASLYPLFHKSIQCKLSTHKIFAHKKPRGFSAFQGDYLFANKSRISFK